MKNRTQIIFKRKELVKQLQAVKEYEGSRCEQALAEFGISLLEWVLSEEVKPNVLIRDEKE